MKKAKRALPLFLTAVILFTPILSQRTEAESYDAPVGIFDKFKSEENAETEPMTEDFTPKRGKNSPDGRNQKENTTKPECPDCSEGDCPRHGHGGKHHHKKHDDAESPKPESETEKESLTTASTAVSNWYCKHMEDGKRPPMPAEMNYIDKHNGYFLGEDDKVIYLTFDAGYENGNIAKILDTLKAEEVPAAFFVLENLVTRNTGLVQRMVDEGHTVCNHTARHGDMTQKSESEFAAELAAMEQIYKEKLGCDLAKYYRPPEGKFTEANLEWADKLGYKTIFWSFAYADWDNNNQMSAEKASAKVLSGTHNGEVLLLHPTSATNAEILPTLIREWKNMGYRFGTLDELTSQAKSSM